MSSFRPAADRNLLFGILALPMDFVGRQPHRRAASLRRTHA
jgi:hypothetical protein